MIKRKIITKLLDALKDSPVVLLHGARQTGKSTLMKYLIDNKYPARYITFDDVSILSAAKEDIKEFLSAYNENLFIDEVQRIPDIFLAIKSFVDKTRTPGKFLLTGSTNVLMLPKLSESLAGRIEILNLYPFSQNEITGNRNNFVDNIFDDKFSLPPDKTNDNTLKQRILAGGYPEIQNRKSSDRKDAWFKSYITTILQRDVKELANIEKLFELPRLLNLFAARAGTLLNFAEISRSSKTPQTTLKRYISLLEATFMIFLLPAWSGNLSKRLIKTPKVYITDTGLLANLAGFNENRIGADPLAWGRIVENFVLMEIVKQISWSKYNLSVYYLRTSSGQEIDLIVERNDGALVCIEVKGTQNISGDMFNNIMTFANETKKKFKRGIILYTGDTAIPFGKDLFGLPMSVLW